MLGNRKVDFDEMETGLKMRRPEEGRAKGKKESRHAMYMYHFSVMNVFTKRGKDTLIKMF